MRVLAAEGYRGARAARAALLRGAAAAQRRGRRGSRAREGRDRGLRRLRPGGRQRRRLRLGDEGLRAHPPRRARLARARRGVLGPGPRRHRAARRARARRRRAIRWRCAPPTTTPATWPTRRASGPSLAALLGPIPGLELLEPDGWEICCGSAGVYNLLQPEAAEELGRRKVENLLATGAEAVIAGEPRLRAADRRPQRGAGKPAGRLPPDGGVGGLDRGKGTR